MFAWFQFQDEALEILKDYREKIVAGEASFDDLASEFSDCSSARNKGDLGPFGRGQMQVSHARRLNFSVEFRPDFIRSLNVKNVDVPFEKGSRIQFLEHNCRNLSRMPLSPSRLGK